jgi:hypothetical protein
VQRSLSAPCPGRGHAPTPRRAGSTPTREGGGAFSSPRPVAAGLERPIAFRTGTAAPRKGPRPTRRTMVAKTPGASAALRRGVAGQSPLHPPSALRPGRNGPEARWARVRPLGLPKRPPYSDFRTRCRILSPDRAATPAQGGKCGFRREARAASAAAGSSKLPATPASRPRRQSRTTVPRRVPRSSGAAATDSNHQTEACGAAAPTYVPTLSRAVLDFPSS